MIIRVITFNQETLVIKVTLCLFAKKYLKV